MFHARIRIALFVCLVVAMAAASAITIRAYSTFGRWATSSVPFYINPQNGDVSASAAETAVLSGMNAWNNQAKTNFKFVYAGRVSDTATGYDNRNVVVFRNASNDSAIATTYSWSVSGQIVDADVIFWDQSFTFVTGTSGCSGAVFIEDVATHEFGHALGLLHSADPVATMYSGYPYCSQELRSLSVDDISGAQSLYGAGTPVSNSVPIVTITSPTAGAVFIDGTAISFAGTATDAEDGNLSSAVTWTSNIDGAIGTGSGFTRVLSAGNHVITASVSDRSGARGSSAVSITVSATSAASPTLTAKGSQTKRQMKVALAWTGLSGAMTDVYRNGVLLLRTSNDGSQTDTMKGSSGTFVYKVCNQGTTTCSNQATVTF